MAAVLKGSVKLLSGALNAPSLSVLRVCPLRVFRYGVALVITETLKYFSYNHCNSDKDNLLSVIRPLRCNKFKVSAVRWFVC